MAEHWLTMGMLLFATTLAFLADADAADLEAIDRIGENRARAILQRARQERAGDEEGPSLAYGRATRRAPRWRRRHARPATIRKFK